MNTRFLKTTLLALSVGAIPAAIALMPPGTADPCYTQTWFGSTTTTSNGCLRYEKCPGLVLCAMGTEDDKVGVIAPKAVNCEVWVQGTLLPDGSCTGGALLGPSTATVTVMHQDCWGWCW